MSTSMPYFIHPSEREKILIRSCEVSIILQDCMTRRAIVIDPGQFLYDWVRTHVKTRQDYVLYSNTLRGCLDYGLFLSMKVPHNKIEASQKLRSFIADMFKELTSLAKEKNFTPSGLLSATEVARQVKLQIESIPDGVLKAGLARTDMLMTDFLHSELSTLATHSGFTLEEYLGPATQNDLSASVAFMRVLDTQFKNTADTVLMGKVVASITLDHIKFLTQAFENFASYPFLKDDIKNAISELAVHWPMVTLGAYRIVGGQDMAISQELLDLLSKKPVK